MARKTDKKTIDPQPRAGIFRVFQANETILKRFLKRITPSSLDVDDITQETILRALQAEKMRDIQEPKAYIFSIAKNVVRDELDKKSRSIVDFIEDFRGPTDISEEPLADEQVDTRQRMLLFWEAVATLPAQCQRVFVLKRFMDIPTRRYRANWEFRSARSKSTRRRD